MDAEGDSHPKAVTKHEKTSLNKPLKFFIQGNLAKRDEELAKSCFYSSSTKFKKKICPLSILFRIKGGFHTVGEIHT